MVIITAALALLLFARGGAYYADIYYDNNRVLTSNLSNETDGIYPIADAPNVFYEVREGKIRFYESDCPDQICVKAGWLERDGDMAACLPNRVWVKVRGEGGQNDALAR